MGFIFTNTDGSLSLDLTDEWYETFEEAAKTLNAEDAVAEEDMQVDSRNIIAEAD